jgi:hypothetical protein
MPGTILMQYKEREKPCWKISSESIKAPLSGIPFPLFKLKLVACGGTFPTGLTRLARFFLFLS